MPLQHQAGKLIVRNATSLTIDPNCCCNNPFAIVVTNSNAQIDDNFDVLLNGVSIGTIDNSINDFTGRIFSQGGIIAANNIVSPNPNAFQATLTLNMALLLVGVNYLVLNTLVNNHNNNAGTVRIGLWKTIGAGYFLSTALVNTSYSFLSPGTQSFSFTL
jgi:hypothetical protein